MARTSFKDDLEGAGARLYGGRWNSVGQAMLYATEHISLAVLELMVNKRTSEFHKASFSLLELYIPDKEIHTLGSGELKKGWHQDMEYTRFIGDHFLQDQQVWILKVPSSVIEEESNFLINPHHAQFKKLHVVKDAIYKLDKRLLGT
ncbi:MAG TPA: RES family NAD+ phosphorylase [Chitinophagaceae bacterium]|nr:RES family NAD+ phosphorylase [Chitinophagaceae bacterium]